MIDHFLELLHPSDGKKKKVTEKAVEKFNTFVETVRNKNVTGYDELNALLDDARQIINGATPEQLSKNQNVKEFVAGKMDEIKLAFNSLVTERGTRRIMLVAPLKQEESPHAN